MFSGKFIKNPKINTYFYPVTIDIQNLIFFPKGMYKPLFFVISML